MPTGLLSFCIAYARKDDGALPAIFTAVRQKFTDLASGSLNVALDQMYEFRNQYVAHEKELLTDKEIAREALRNWIGTLLDLHAARA